METSESGGGGVSGGGSYRLVPVGQPIKYKYSEDLALAELAQYLASTYSGHYKSIENDIQTIDVWEALGSVEPSCRDVGIKYLMRYGKKEGFNRKDILKTIHYCIFLLHFNSKRTLTCNGGTGGGAGTTTIPCDGGIGSTGRWEHGNFGKKD